MKKNLLNMGDGKTTAVIAFIESLEPLPIEWNEKQMFEFGKIIKKTKREFNLNKKLDIIGYRPNKEPVMYDWIDNLTDKK